MTLTPRRMVPSLLCLFPAMLSAFSDGTQTGYTGAATALPIDGAGRTCTQCHAGTANTFNGRVTIGVTTYKPGQRQEITLRVEDTTALRWGFQITARLASDQTRPAGFFIGTSNVRVRCPDGSDAPEGVIGACNGQVQFAGHNGLNTRRAEPGPQTFVIDWMPPGRDVGQIVFYAAAVAANNDADSTGDHIYTASIRAGAEPCNLSLTPFLSAGGVTNGASFATGMSPNSLISLFGGQFFPSGASYRAQPPDLIDGKLHTEMACVGVEIAGVRAPVFFANADQINAQAPLLTQTGPLPVVVIINPGTPNEARSPAVNIPAAAVQPGLFKIDDKTIAGYNASRGNALLGVDGTTAAPGDVVVLFGTGFGLTDPVYQAGEFAFGAAPMPVNPTVTIGGITLNSSQVEYAGLASDAPGFFQFNLRIPDGVSDGDRQVTISVNGLPSQTGATIPIRR